MDGIMFVGRVTCNMCMTGGHGVHPEMCESSHEEISGTSGHGVCSRRRRHPVGG